LTTANKGLEGDNLVSGKGKKVQVQRPVNSGRKVEPEKWDGKFKSVEPLKNQKPPQPRQARYKKWNHPATINWIMGQADPVGFLASVMQGKEMFPVYTQDQDGAVENIGKVGADPELRVMAAKTLLGKCIPDLKAVEITAQIEERKVLDISRLTDNDLTTIERVLEHAVIEGSPSGEDEEIAEGVYQELLASD
tara:strand:+ start:844 stop:1422 length:579 start_codon:yes stop_codon:yes gene_type:complete